MISARDREKLSKHIKNKSKDSLNTKTRYFHSEKEIIFLITRGFRKTPTWTQGELGERRKQYPRPGGGRALVLEAGNDTLVV